MSSQPSQPRLGGDAVDGSLVMAVQGDGRDQLLDEGGGIVVAFIEDGDPVESSSHRFGGGYIQVVPQFEDGQSGGLDKLRSGAEDAERLGVFVR